MTEMDKTRPESIREIVSRIVSRFKPEKIILFGSRGRGEAAPDSDVDLLVVMPVSGSKRRLDEITPAGSSVLIDVSITDEKDLAQVIVIISAEPR